MDKKMILYALILLVGVFISAVSQVLLKKEAMKEHTGVLQEYLNVRVILAYTMFVGTTLLSVLAYRGIPLSMGPVLEATSYIYVTIFGIKVFHEKLNQKKVIALILIIMGIVVYSVWG